MDTRTILGALISASDRAPEKQSVRLVGERGYTALEMLDRAAHVAGLLKRSGVTAGDRVVIMLSNRIEFLDVFFAAAHLGALSVPLNTSLRGPILEHMVSDSDPSVIITEAQHLEVLGAAVEAVGLTARLFVIHAEPTSHAVDVVDFATALAASTPADMAEVTRYNDACILYTSGTTGPSKGVLHTHNSIIAFGESTDRFMNYRPSDVAHNCLPLFHANALCVSLLPALRVGATVVFGDRFSASNYWREVRDEGATVVSILGAMVPILWGREPSADDQRNSVRVALSVPTPPADIYEHFEKRFGLRLVSQYGMSDTSCVISTPPGVSGRPGYAGVVNPNFECVVADEHDEPVPDGVAGQLLIRPRRPDLMMSCYWNNPQATMDTWRNLWFHSGDVLVREPDGWFKFVDRQKDAMRRFGENISSFEVESVIARHPSVEEVAVYAVPAELSEDEVMAAVVLVPGASEDLHDLGQFCDQHLPYFASPRYLVVLPSLPKTSTSKVRKDELRREGVTTQAVDRGPRGRKTSKVR